MNDKLKIYRKQIDGYLDSLLPWQDGPFNRLYEAMRYSTCIGGKRIRPILMQLAYEAVGGDGDISCYLCAMEMVHTYSLIHDDLPAMDNDDLRRGQPTNHKYFDEATAILAGDGLLSYAFQLMIEDVLFHEDMARLKAAHVLSDGCGVFGMVAGQLLDVVSDGVVIDLETLDCIHLHKTGALIKASTKMGAILGYGSPVEVMALEMYGQYIGKVFQIVDDILDEVADEEELGKPVNSDKKNEKTTYTTFYTIEECYHIATELTNKAIACLDKVEGDTTLLKEIAQDLVHRKK